MVHSKKYLLGISFFILLTASFAEAQDPVPVIRSSNKVILEGKVYYVHIVKEGQTLYSISRAYNVTEKEIIIENPGATSLLSIGQVLKIPTETASSVSSENKVPIKNDSVYLVKKGETLYSISRKYKCSVEEILELNPGLEINKIQEGSEIRIPVTGKGKNELSFNEEGFIFHRVKQGETLFSISRYYDVDIKEIREVNRHLGWGGPRSGDVLRIPQPNTTVVQVFSPDSLVLDSAEQVTADTLLLVEGYDYDELKDLFAGSKKSYSIAYLIPFDYKKKPSLDSLLKDVKSAQRRERITEEYRLEAAKPLSVNFLEFLEGSLLAIDSMTSSGMKLDIRIYDTKRSMFRTRQILDNPEMENMDLIIGPFYTYNLELVSEFARKNRIPLVTPFNSNDSLLNDNPYLIQPNPSFKTELKYDANFIGRLYDRNLVFVHTGDTSQLKQVEFYKQLLFDELEKYSMLEDVQFKEVVLLNNNTDALIHAMSPDLNNLVILPSTDEAFASQVATRLYYELPNYSIELFGSSYWVGFDDIDISYIHALGLIISHMIWYDYSDPDYASFLSKYRKNFYREPGAFTRNGSSFAVTGYDLSLYFLSALKEFGPRFIIHLDEFAVNETIAEFDYQRISRKGGYSNNFMRYYHFDEGLVVREIGLPEPPKLHQFHKPAVDKPGYLNWTTPESDSSNVSQPN